ncbi:MAG: glycerate kinase [Muribaculaceae bacterium]|nr:glycerate kinase [Muribaculaceae bacterium]
MARIIAAFDSMKGSLTSREAGEVIREALRGLRPEAETDIVVTADGGEGTSGALMAALGGSEVECSVCGPAGGSVIARYGISAKDGRAIMEMASASGITLLNECERNPMRTTTLGVGQMILDAARRGCRHIVIGLGGSATNDGGMGMLSALGVRFFDSAGVELAPVGGNLVNVSRVDTSGIPESVRALSFTVACDVDSPLYGPDGAAYVFAPQKGADPAMVDALDRGLRNYARVIGEAVGKDVAMVRGAGAAGGLGAAFVAFLNSRIKRGIDVILDAAGFDELLNGATLVVTGEGSMDGQTLMGKAPAGILRRALGASVPTVAFAGRVSDRESLLAAGFAAVEAITPASMPLEVAMRPEVARGNLMNAARRVLPMWV